MNQAWESWCNTVLSQVRFQPDHKAIRRELMGHMEDGRADLERLGYGRELAEQRTLDAMGSAFLVGSAMDKAHHPLLGWIWRVSRWLVMLLLVLTVYTAATDIGAQEIVDRTVKQFQASDPPATAVALKLGRDTVYYDPEMVVKQNGDSYSIGVRLWMQDGFPWRMDPYYMFDTWITELMGTDEQGNYKVTAHALGGITPQCWNRRSCIVYVEHMDHVPQWLELRYPYGENNWVIQAERGRGT